MIIRSISVKHHAEIAHRLSLTPGKCQNIHGHSISVVLKLSGEVDETGKMFGIDISTIKDVFRAYLDDHYDHRLLLNGKDPLLTPFSENTQRMAYPGLKRCESDPTTENIAAWIFGWAAKMFETATAISVDVVETDTNAASCFGEVEGKSDDASSD